MATATSYQEHAVDPTDTVDPPAGGSRYTTLASWWTATKAGGGSNNIASWAKCYGGGNLAAVDIDGAGYAGTSDYYTRVYTAEGERHDGTLGSAGAYIEANSGNLLVADENYTRIEGLRLVGISGANTAIHVSGVADVENVLIDSVMVERGTAGLIYGFRLYGTYTNPSYTVRNCLFCGLGEAGYRYPAISLRPVIGKDLTAIIQNCSVNGWASNGYGVHYNDEVSTIITATVQNVISTGNGIDFLEKGDGTLNITQTYCLSEDDTADDWGGAGNVTGEAAADVFENPASDLNLKVGSPAIGAGVNLYTAFTVDAIGAARLLAGAWDMGGLTTPLIAYYLYRGVGGISNVDFATPVGEVKGAASSGIWTGLGHEANTRYTYVLRPARTLADDSILIAPDYSCRIEFETDESGDWLGNRPGSIEALSAEVISGGVIRLRWNFRTPYGGDAPNDFGIYYSTSPDITPGSPNTTKSYTADGAYSKDITLSDGVAYYFAITARDATPVESHISDIIGPFIADDTAPDAPTLITATTF